MTRPDVETALPDGLRGQLPTFLVIGTNKSGTTTLYDVLKQHRQVFLPFRKELHFFSDDVRYARGVDWYVQSFFQGSAGCHVRGDVTPTYLYWGEKVIPRIKAVYGDTPPRMIVILRDPVERAYSRYWHQRRIEEREPLSFEDALAAEPERILEDAGTFGVRGRFPRAYFQGGLYGAQLERYFTSFPAECFHVMLFQDLQRDFAGTIRGLLAFLGVDETVDIARVRSNPASVTRAPRFNAWLRSRSTIGGVVRRVLPGHSFSYVRKAMRWAFLKPAEYPPINPDTEQQLRQRYLPDIRKLETLIGRSLDQWYPQPPSVL